MSHSSASCLGLLSRFAGRAAASESSSAADLKLKNLQQQIAEVSSALWEEFGAYQKIMSIITPSKLALLLWTDKDLRARAESLGVGHRCTSDAVEDAQLRHLLDARQAAYVALAMAAHRWQSVWEIYEKLQDLNAILYGHDVLWSWETRAITNSGMFKHWEQWAEAFSMVPGSDFYQRLYNELPSYFQQTRQQNREAWQAQVERHAYDAQRAALPKCKSF